MNSIGFIGAGNMAEALIKGITKAGLFDSSNIFISDVDNRRLDLLASGYGVRAAKTNEALARSVEIIVLSVKPQNMAEVLRDIAPAAGGDKLVISIAAGKRTADIAAVLPSSPVVRVMPNTPALVGEGASAIFAGEGAAGMLKTVESIFSSVGATVVVEDERLMDAVTAVSGSGPAYYFLLTEEIIKAAVRLGLPAEAANRLVLQTAKGSALLAAEAAGRGLGPAELRQNVTSKGGTTEAAVKVLSEGDFGGLVNKAVAAACSRSRQLSG
jgi:pyrroline-5-carboxylate reductase